MNYFFNFLFLFLSNFLTIRRIMRLTSDQAEVKNFDLEGRAGGTQISLWIQLPSGLDLEWSSSRGFLFESYGREGSKNQDQILKQIRYLTKNGKVAREKIRAYDPEPLEALRVIY